MKSCYRVTKFDKKMCAGGLRTYTLSVQFVAFVIVASSDLSFDVNHHEGLFRPDASMYAGGLRTYALSVQFVAFVIVASPDLSFDVNHHEGLFRPDASAAI